MIGDTIFNAKTYHIISEEDAGSCTLSCTWWYDNTYKYIREDTTKRIWKFDTFTMSDALLYDFNLNIGDTIHSSLVLFGEYDLIQSIDSTFIGNNYRKIYYYNSSFINDTCTHFLIEGIGGGAGLFSPLCGMCGEAGSMLECFKQNGNILYYQGSGFCFIISPDTLTVCDFTVPVSETKSEKYISLFPNPAITEVTINFGKAAHYNVQLCNILGEVLEQTQTNSSALSLNMSSYTRGIYFITVTDENKNKVVRKVVKM